MFAAALVARLAFVALLAIALVARLAFVALLAGRTGSDALFEFFHRQLLCVVHTLLGLLVCLLVHRSLS